jgi:hypothetical protein
MSQNRSGMADFNEIAGQVIALAEMGDLNKIARKIASPEVAEIADFNEIAHKIAQQVPRVGGRVADVSAAAREKGARMAGGKAGWLILPAAGAAVYAAAKNGSAIVRSVRFAKERALEMAELDLLHRAKELTGFDDGRRDEGRRSGQRRLDAGELEEHLRDRSERRKRRRESMS